MVTLADALLATTIVELLRILDAAQPWRADAACLEHPEVEFFVGRGVSAGPAKAVCAGCLVRQECAEYAHEHNIIEGTWGGLSGRDRRNVRNPRSSPPKPRPKLVRPRCADCGGVLPPGRVGLCCECAEAAAA